MIFTLFLIIYNFCRIAINKVMNPVGFKVNWIQRISPMCSLKIYGDGTIVIGRNCEFAPYCDFEVHGKGRIEIGDKTYFNRFCMISSHERVKVGRGCMFGPGVKIFDNNHKYSPSHGVCSDLTTGTIEIGDRTWIGSNVIILKGSKIGSNCVIGAGCVVRGIVPDGKVLVNRQCQELL